jgi:hypothetical protein
VPTFRAARVAEILEERPGLQRLQVQPLDATDAGRARAYVLTELTGPVSVGERVVCNTTAVDHGLGTGGWHVVLWSLDRDALSAPGGGHIMKLRYTGLQHDTGSAEEDHPNLPDTLDGTPVVACTVHSQVAAVALGVRAVAPEAKVVYVMTDGAALPIALSDLVDALVTRGVLEGTVTAGHAFGGDVEAVSVPSALLVARHLLGADVIVVGMGPGVVGTGTTFGTTAVEAASVLSATAALGGAGILAVRASEGDDRPRHRGLSHHVLAVLRLCFAPCVVPVVDGLRDELPALEAVARPGHELRRAATLPIGELLGGHDLTVRTMGRTVEQDRLYFESAAAAGAAAGALLGAPDP